jgi:4-amino-4-deoxy-L-arabinose transferase-like glycosyltransferase
MLNNRRLWALVLGFAALHLALAAWLPLVEDEAYYAMWASVPSAGYYDHPPMVAWGIWAGQWVLGDGTLGIRLLSVIAGGLVTLLTYRIAWLYSGEDRLAFRAALWGKAMLPLAVLGFAATPDAPSVLFWTAAVWALAELQAGKRPEWWLAVGLFAGLGVLSKFTNLFFGLALVIWLLASRNGRVWLRRWQVWAGAGVGILVLVPFALWNADHGWIGLERQFGRVGAAEAFSLFYFAMYWVSVVLLVTPVLFVLAARGLGRRETPPVLIWLVAPILLYLTWHATKSVAGGQWLLPIFPSLAVIAALSARAGWLVRLAAPVGLGLSALILVVGFWPGRVIIPGQNPFNQGRGWDQVREEIRAQAAGAGAVWIATDAYGLTGQLHHYLNAELPVWSVTQSERYLYRGALPEVLCREPAVFYSRTEFTGGVPYFETSTPLPVIERRESDRVLMRYYGAVVRGVKGCE